MFSSHDRLTSIWASWWNGPKRPINQRKCKKKHNFFLLGDMGLILTSNLGYNDILIWCWFGLRNPKQKKVMFFFTFFQILDLEVPHATKSPLDQPFSKIQKCFCAFWNRESVRKTIKLSPHLYVQPILHSGSKRATFALF